MRGFNDIGRLLSAAIVVSTFFVVQTARGAVIRQITDARIDTVAYTHYALSDAGNVAAAALTGFDVPTNPLHAYRPVTWTLPAGTPAELALLDRAASVSVSDDGMWLACLSSADPLGTNPDHGRELFTVRTDGTMFSQVTSVGPTAGTIVAAQISGNGNRVLFLSDRDPLGSNPQRRLQLFVVNRTGTNLAQLTSFSTGLIREMSIDDAAARIVFTFDGDPDGGNADGSVEVFAIEATGVNLRQLTSLPNDQRDSVRFVDLQISGNGGLVIMRYQDDFGSARFEIDWNGGGYVMVPFVSGDATIRDDAKYVFYAAGGAVYSLSLSGGSPVLLATPPAGASYRRPVVSGDGTRLLLERIATSVFAAPQLFALNADGSGLLQLTSNASSGSAREARLSASGTRVAYLRAQTGDASRGLVVMDADGGNAAQVAGGSVNLPAITGDGGILTFTSYVNPGSHVMRVNDDASGLIQLDPPPNEDISGYQDIADNGSWVVFESTGNFTGGSGGSTDLFRVAPDGSGMLQLTANPLGGLIMNPRIDASGMWVVYHDDNSPGGGNPDASDEVFRVRTDASGLQQLTSDPTYDSNSPDVSGNGQRITWVSDADPLGTNADHNYEVFLYEPGSATLRQLTSTVGGDNLVPRISTDGAYVDFVSNVAYYEPVVAPSEYEPYRVTVATATVERTGGLGLEGAGILTGPRWFSFASAVTTDDDGQRVIFVGGRDRTGTNPDLNDEVWMADWNAPAVIRPGKAEPTVVTWDPEPKPLRYDVIRGDVASLAPGPGSTVDLGPVACVEDESIDATTSGFDDVPQPAPGQVFFYLYRGRQGIYDGAGSYGQGTGATERVPASGDCPM